MFPPIAVLALEFAVRAPRLAADCAATVMLPAVGALVSMARVCTVPKLEPRTMLRPTDGANIDGMVVSAVFNTTSPEANKPNDVPAIEVLETRAPLLTELSRRSPLSATTGTIRRESKLSMAVLAFGASIVVKPPGVSPDTDDGVMVMPPKLPDPDIGLVKSTPVTPAVLPVMRTALPPLVVALASRYTLPGLFVAEVLIEPICTAGSLD